MTMLAEQIPLDRLVAGHWYVGRGRNGNVGLWDGKNFLVIAEKLGRMVIKYEPNYTEESGCFQPFAKVDEGMMIEPFGKGIRSSQYGRMMAFGQAATDEE